MIPLSDCDDVDILGVRRQGLDIFAAGYFPDDEVVQLSRLNEDQWPMLIVGLQGHAIPVREPDADETVWFEGRQRAVERIRNLPAD